MATGDTLFILTPMGGTPPATLYATLDTIAGTTDAPLPIHSVLDYDGAADEHMDWYLTVPSHYVGTTGFTFAYKFAMSGTVGTDVQMEFRVRKFTSGTTALAGDIDITGATATTLIATPDGVANVFDQSGTANMPKANAGTPVAGDRIIIRASRNFDYAVNGDDLQLLEILVTET